MKVQLIGTAMILLLVCAGDRTEAQECTENSNAEFVQYCDLVHNPGRYDGHVVRTEAVWQSMIHTGALADRSCSASGPELLLTLPSFSSSSNSKSSLRKKLQTFLRKDGAAQVRIMGTFHDLKDRFYEDGQRFQIEIKCLMTVAPVSPADRGN